MECYQCGCLLTENDFCTNCGADVRVYKKIIAASNRYYNIGLERAGVRDLSGAVESLRQCLKLNKNHAEARNLLGLVYYETGEVVSALNEWVMSKNIQPHKNIADDYIEDIRSNPSQLDTLTQAVKKYNQALNYCRQDSIDLAVIQLKKVLSMNPKYLQAHQLLALIYMSQEDWEKAEKEVEKALRIDNSNTVTMRYMREIDQVVSQQEGKTPSKKKKGKEEKNARKYKNGNDTVIQPINGRDSRGLSTVLNMIIGVAIGLAVAVFLILPARIQTEVSKVNEEITKYSELLNQKTADVQEREDRIESMQSEIDSLKEALDAYTGTDGTIAAYEQLLEAVSLYMAEEPDFMAVADSLGRIDEEYVAQEAPEYFKNVYDALLVLIGPDVSASYYETGMAEYNVQNYSEAINYLEMAVAFNAEDSKALYQLAEAYYRNEDMENAAIYYNRVIELFPGYTSAVNAQRRLNEIEAE